MSALLRATGGPFAGQSFSLTGEKFLIGREKDCHLKADSPLVSRHHCVLIQDPYTLRVRDLGSRNGTFVNGRRVHGEVVLAQGDLVVVGETTFQVVIPQGAGPAPAPAAPPVQSADRPTGVYDGNTQAPQGAYPPPQSHAAGNQSVEGPQTIPIPVLPPPE